jgi:hypothetical protein
MSCIKQSKNHVLSTWLHKNKVKCVEEDHSLFMDVLVVPQEMILTLPLLVVQLDASY